MTNPALNAAAITATVAAVTLEAQATDAPSSVQDLIAKIKDKDDKVRGPAWQSAGTYGAPAVKPLADVMVDPEMEVARAAKRALWKVVRYAGRPGADREKRAAVTELLSLLDGRPTVVRREVLWMLSEIGADEAVKPIALLLGDRELREDSRAALERIPGSKSLAALKDSLTIVPEEFKPAIAQSLRVRGVKIADYPSQKLVPTRPNTSGAAKTL